MTYTRYGSPWVDGGAPGISSSFLTGVEDWLISVDQSAVTTLTGTTAGSVKLYQPLTGIVRASVFWLNGYQNNSGVRQHITLPVPFLHGCSCIVGRIHSSGTFGCYVYSGGVGGTLQNFNQYNNAGSVTPTTHILAGNIGEVTGGWDTLEFDGGYSSAMTAFIVCIGL